MAKVDFVVIGSGGGGGTIAWLLAKAQFSVLLLEQGPDFAARYALPDEEFNPAVHDEYLFRLQRPDPKRRRRGDYCTFRTSDTDSASRPFVNGWTGSVLGGGSILWGTWSFRALPIDFKLETHFNALGQLAELKSWGYSVQDWPIDYAALEPYYGLAEALFSVGGDRQGLNSGVISSAWYRTFSAMPHFSQLGSPSSWQPGLSYPCAPYPRSPVGQFVYDGMRAAGMAPFTLPNAIVTPPPDGQLAPNAGAFRTRDALTSALAAWPADSRPEFWKTTPQQLWSDSVRHACRMCGYCGEYLCFGKSGPKSGTRFSTIKELMGMAEASNKVQIKCNSRAYQIDFDEKRGLATGVRYLDLTDENDPKSAVAEAANVIVSCGAVQSTRLLRMSGPPAGLGNSRDQLGRYASFHLFGLSATITLPPNFQGALHSEIGHTGSTASFAPYFIQNPDSRKWFKGGTAVSTAKKNILEAAGSAVGGGAMGLTLLKAMERANRTLELRFTGDDLPMPRNRVDLDPTYVDEYGLPVARITRNPGEHEWQMAGLAGPMLAKAFDYYRAKTSTAAIDVKVNPPIISLASDHQMGTCRMGRDPATSVVNENCQLHDAKNVLVVDSSFMPSSLGLNPMMTVVANALRVGSWVVTQIGPGDSLR